MILWFMNAISKSDEVSGRRLEFLAGRALLLLCYVAICHKYAHDLYCTGRPC